MDDSNRIREERLKKLEALRAEGVNPFANGFAPAALCAEVQAHAKTEAPPPMDRLPTDAAAWSVAGRLVAKNDMGKASFMRLRDRSDAQLQIYLRKDVAAAADWNLYKHHLDLGDIVGVRGRLFQTKTGEPTLMV